MLRLFYCWWNMLVENLYWRKTCMLGKYFHQHAGPRAPWCWWNVCWWNSMLVGYSPWICMKMYVDTFTNIQKIFYQHQFFTNLSLNWIRDVFISIISPRMLNVRGYYDSFFENKNQYCHILDTNFHLKYEFITLYKWNLPRESRIISFCISDSERIQPSFFYHKVQHNTLGRKRFESEKSPSGKLAARNLA